MQSSPDETNGKKDTSSLNSAQAKVISELYADPHTADVIAKADYVMSLGSTVFFKWTCGGCGERVTCSTPDTLFTSFAHEDCGYVTKTIDGNLGFLVVTELRENKDN